MPTLAFTACTARLQSAWAVEVEVASKLCAPKPLEDELLGIADRKTKVSYHQIEQFTT
jgi:hypothetical protein